eukprot:TRINITY_DN924_c0_g1_i1.p2 TRINITY_DN924_c0_g1~~TRINITY_DN924_c0_g1_i1.p2  ORF type:complete len:155 (-),score=70.47 TRINITY_DN924_c0_g1_i1:171-599(-)
MGQFLGVVEQYVQNQVNDVCWRDLLRATAAAATLDDAVRSHARYASALLHRCFLDTRSGKLPALLESIVDTVAALTAATPAAATPAQAPTLLSTIAALDKQFTERVKLLYAVLHTLCYKGGIQPHLHQLLLLLNFNSFYHYS